MTDTNKMREQFEAWILENWPGQYLDRFETGEYHGFTLEHCWKAWQASREAVVVELPDSIVGARRYQHAEAAFAHKEGIDDCREAIEAQGLKVAP